MSVKRQWSQTSMEICSLNQEDKQRGRKEKKKKETDKAQLPSGWRIQVPLLRVFGEQLLCLSVSLKPLPSRRRQKEIRGDFGV
jgi:hypothetical protein